MLVILSDLHLTDESTSSNVHETAFKNILLPEITANAKNYSAQEIRVILLGDIFDLVRTDYWVSQVPDSERPWNGTLDPNTGMNTHSKVEVHYNNILDKILKNHSGKALIEVLNSVKRDNVYTKVTYIIGNHDRALNVFDSLKDKVKSKITNVDEVEFLNVLYAPEYSVLARHGHEWDINNYGYEFYTKVLNRKANVNRFDSECYKTQTIGEVVTAELMAGFIYELKQQLGDTNPGLIKQLMEVNNVRPMTDAFLWIEWFGRNMLKDDKEKKIILQSLQKSLDNVLKTDLSKAWDNLVEEVFLLRGDLTDRFDQLNKFIKGKSFDDLKGSVELFKFFEGIFGSSKDDYVEGSKKEWEFKPLNEIQYVLYGHTHEARYDYFNASVDGAVRMYINTGTYLPLIQRIDRNGFSSAYQLTMVFCYNDKEDQTDKRDGSSIEIWNGIKRKNYK